MKNAPPLLVDTRAGSKELIDPLHRLKLPVQEAFLEFGDLAFVGRGPGGEDKFIGIEYKKLPDLVSSIRSGRLQGHQMPGMRDTFDMSYLLIEGELQYDDQGVLLKRVGRSSWARMPGQMRVGELLKRVNVLHLCGGLIPIWAHNKKLAVTMLEMLYRTWTDCNLDEHSSHLEIYHPPTLVPVSQFRRTVSTLPGVGFEWSRAAEVRFCNLYNATTGCADDWASLNGKDGKAFGLKRARAVVDALRGGDE